MAVPSSHVRTFSDPDHYAASVRATALELTVTSVGQFVGKTVRIDLHDLWMQRFSENLPHVGHSAIAPGRAVVSFWTRQVAGAAWNGLDTDPSQIVWHGEAEQFYRRASGPSQRASMSLPTEVMASAVSTMAGCNLAPRRQGRLITPRPAAMARLQRLHAEVADLAERASAIIANPATARALEQSLIEAMVGCLDQAEDHEDSTARRRHQNIMRRFRRVLEENPDTVLYLPDICAAVGVPARTLLRCCHEYLGMGPKQYLLRRHLHLMRRALRATAPGSTTVTDIFAQHGVWQFGRFASRYKHLFGEKPSETLRCADRSIFSDRQHTQAFLAESE